jgi:hypothetical protein
VPNATALTETGEEPVVTKYYFLALSKTGAGPVSTSMEMAELPAFSMREA